MRRRPLEGALIDTHLGSPNSRYVMRANSSFEGPNPKASRWIFRLTDAWSLTLNPWSLDTGTTVAK